MLLGWSRGGIILSISHLSCRVLKGMMHRTSRVSCTLSLFHMPTDGYCGQEFQQKPCCQCLLESTTSIDYWGWGACGREGDCISEIRQPKLSPPASPTLISLDRSVVPSVSSGTHGWPSLAGRWQFGMEEARMWSPPTLDCMWMFLKGQVYRSCGQLSLHLDNVAPSSVAHHWMTTEEWTYGRSMTHQHHLGPVHPMRPCKYQHEDWLGCGGWNWDNSPQRRRTCW